jgi:hypothetical protein
MEKLSAVMTEASRKSKKGITSSVSTVKSTIVSFIVSEVLNTAKQDKKPQANDLYNLVKEKLLLAGEIKNKEKEQGDKAGEADVKLLPEEGTFISSAGICLLAPYLPAFFKTLELCDRASFYSAGKQQHAVYLVNYLATGELEPSEEKLVFSKLLCGWPLQMPCLDTDGISAFEVKESVELLESVINHWAALKKTTPDGLREGFLKRRGKLAESDEHFVLQMEQQSIDVLLDQVPWTFRLIKLPWMKKSVMVEWF